MIEKKVIALGFFDGVHLGHQALLRECCRLARENNALPSAVTFETHPDALVFGKAPEMINTSEDRLQLLKSYGIGPVYIIPFDRKTMTMPWQDFFRLLLDFGAVGIVCGDDYRCGYRGEGTAEKMKAACAERNMPCVVVPEQDMGGVRISSTHIRSLMADGKMEDAVRFLGHPHILSGEVVNGQHLGRTIGIPTANLALPEGVLVPKMGVYACKAEVDGKTCLAVTNVGKRPTVNGTTVTVEPWILDFDGDLYGKMIRLEFYKFLRPERKFDSLADLQQEIWKNAAQTREFFGKN